MSKIKQSATILKGGTGEKNQDDDLYFMAYRAMCLAEILEREIFSLLQEAGSKNPISGRLEEINVLVTSTRNIFTRKKRGDLLDAAIGIQE